jgi:hypothetical protein
MMRRPLRGLWLLALVLAALSLRSGGCRKKPPAPPASTAPSAAVNPQSWPTPLLTPPPPQPSPTLWKGVTAVPALPE